MPDKAAFSAIVVFFSRRPTQYGVIRPVQAAAASYSKLREELLLCLGSVHISSHGNLLAQKRACRVEKPRKVSKLAALFNAADAFSGAKYTYKSKCQDTPGRLMPIQKITLLCCFTLLRHLYCCRPAAL